MKEATMPDEEKTLDDGLGPDPMDRGSAKPMGTGTGGGGSYIDPSYEDALKILGREDAMPKPWVQHAQIMDNAEGADLARRLTRLRTEAGALSHAVEPPTEVGKAVQAFIRALHNPTASKEKRADLRQEIESKGDDDVVGALAEVCAHPGVEARLAGKNPGPDLGELPDFLRG
jgi:hypothetical protein